MRCYALLPWRENFPPNHRVAHCGDARKKGPPRRVTKPPDPIRVFPCGSSPGGSEINPVVVFPPSNKPRTCLGHVALLAQRTPR